MSTFVISLMIGLALGLAVLMIGVMSLTQAAQDTSHDGATYVGAGRTLLEWRLPEGVRCYSRGVDTLSCVVVTP